jgi:plastocyanin
MPPVTQIRSGTQVLWTTATGSHPTTNTTSVAQQCFSVAVGPNVVPVAVQFDVADGALAATDDGKTTPCGNALALPTGAFLLPYQCILHVEMHGALVVEP